jgi:hypothetical protein
MKVSFYFSCTNRFLPNACALIDPSESDSCAVTDFSSTNRGSTAPASASAASFPGRGWAPPALIPEPFGLFGWRVSHAPSAAEGPSEHIAGRLPTPRQCRWDAIRLRAPTTATAPRACSAPRDDAEVWVEAGVVGASRACYAWWTRRTRSTIRWVGAGRIPLLNLLSSPIFARRGPY